MKKFIVGIIVSLCYFTAYCVNTMPEVPIIWGVNGHPLVQQVYLNSDLETQFKIIKHFGFSYYRIDVSADANGTIIDHQLFFKILALARKNNVKILPMFYLSGLDLNSTPDISFKRGKVLGEGIGKRYGAYFDYYELGNEEELKIIHPNTNGDRSDQYDLKGSEVTAAFLRGMSQGIKKNDPTGKIIIDFAGWLHYEYLTMLVAKKVGFDIIGLHWYSDMGKLTNVGSMNINILKLLTLKFKKPIWITEINRRNGSMNDNSGDQLFWIKNYLMECKNNRNVKAFFFYELYDEQGSVDNPESNYGLVSWDPALKNYSYKPISSVLTIR